MAAYGRHPTAQVLQIHNHFLLIDCGEGTQFRMDELRVRKSAISHIFISHLHGDHYFGLIGLLTSYNLQGRTAPLHIFGPEGLEPIILLQLQYGETQLKYDLIFSFTQNEEPALILDHPSFTVHTLPLQHKIPSTGFLFREKITNLRIRKEMISLHGISHHAIKAIKAGADHIKEDGTLVPNADLVYPAAPPRAYAFCTDTTLLENLPAHISGVDLLYHEATFAADAEELAQITFHSTTKQAASVASSASVKKLLIGHFSSRYRDLEPLLAEAREIFQNTELAIEGNVFTV